MKKSTVIAIIVALVLIFLGLIVCVCALFSVDFDLKQFNVKTMYEKKFDVTENFTKVQAELGELDIRVIPSDDESCTVICYENDKVSYNVSVEDDTLYIIKQGNYDWYDNIGISITNDQAKITLYLPEDQYEALKITSASGDVYVSDKLTFKSLEIDCASADVEYMATSDVISVKTASGDIELGNSNAVSAEISSVSGDVSIKNMSMSESTSIKTTSGDVEAENIECAGFTCQTTSGEIELAGVVSGGSMTVSTKSGEVELSGCDAESLDIKTVSGDVSGVIITGKKFNCNSVSGNIRVPDDADGGECSINTTSGDIYIKIK